MKKYAIAAAICLTVVMVATLVFAAAVKVGLDPYAPSNGYGDGKAVLNYAKGDDKTEIQVNCSGLIAGMEYSVHVGNGGWTEVGRFVAAKKGKGHLHVRRPGDVSTLSRLP